MGFLLLLVACGGGERNSSTAAGSEQKPGVANAEHIYNQQCSVCHGSKADGDSPLGSAYPGTNLADGDWQHGGSRSAVIETISTGVTGTPMRGFQGTLTSDEIEAVADYVLSMSQ